MRPIGAETTVVGRIELELIEGHETSARLMDGMSYPHPGAPSPDRNATGHRAESKQGGSVAKINYAVILRSFLPECAYCATSSSAGGSNQFVSERPPSTTIAAPVT
jgi:hypothetical protein